MTCFTPIRAFRGDGGKVVFSARAGFSDRPINLPCGKCIGCRVKKAQEWALRCSHEASLYDHNCFLTLTYAPERLPKDLSLDKTHWQNFVKRWRKELAASACVCPVGTETCRCKVLRYLHCGEYGPRTFRPHYHAVVFGQDFHEDRVLFEDRGANSLYHSRTLDRLWSHGLCTIGSVNKTTAEYVARYTLKKARVDWQDGSYRRLDPETGEEWFVEPEYATMSRRPGIGAAWYDKFKGDLFPSDECVADGRVHGVPRFYSKRLEAEDAEMYSRVKRKRADREFERTGYGPSDLFNTLFAVPRGADGLPVFGENSYERMAVKEDILRRKSENGRDGL